MEDLSWRAPVQKRGIERVEAILEATRNLILENGGTDVKMTEVAKVGAVPIGSLYQYFPTRTALLSRLFEVEMAHVDRLVRSGLKRARSIEELIGGVDPIMRGHWEMVRERPVLNAIWSCPVVDPVIGKADLKNTRANADAMTERFLELAETPVSRAPLYAACLLVCHLWGAVIRLCFAAESEREVNQITEQYVAMIQGQLRNLAAQQVV